MEIQQLLWRINGEEDPEHRLAIHEVLKEVDPVFSSSRVLALADERPLAEVQRK